MAAAAGPQPCPLWWPSLPGERQRRLGPKAGGAGGAERREGAGGPERDGGCSRQAPEDEGSLSSSCPGRVWCPRTEPGAGVVSFSCFPTQADGGRAEPSGSRSLAESLRTVGEETALKSS